MLAVATTESDFHPYAISVNRPQQIASSIGLNNQAIELARQPNSKLEAILWMRWLLRHRISVSVGLLQVSTENAARFHLNPEQLLDVYKRQLRDGQKSLVHPVVMEKMQEMLNREDKEFSGVLSTAKTTLILYSDPLVQRSIEDSDFTINDLKHFKYPVSLYLVVPPSDIERLKPCLLYTSRCV